MVFVVVIGGAEMLIFRDLDEIFNEMTCTQAKATSCSMIVTKVVGVLSLCAPPPMSPLFMSDG